MVAYFQQCILLFITYNSHVHVQIPWIFRLCTLAIYIKKSRIKDGRTQTVSSGRSKILVLHLIIIQLHRFDEVYFLCLSYAPVQVTSKVVDCFLLVEAIIFIEISILLYMIHWCLERTITYIKMSKYLLDKFK